MNALCIPAGPARRDRDRCCRRGPGAGSLDGSSCTTPCSSIATRFRGVTLIRFHETRRVRFHGRTWRGERRAMVWGVPLIARGSRDRRRLRGFDSSPMTPSSCLRCGSRTMRRALHGVPPALSSGSPVGQRRSRPGELTKGPSMSKSRRPSLVPAQGDGGKPVRGFELRQHPRCVGAVLRLAEDRAVEDDFGIGRQHAARVRAARSAATSLVRAMRRHSEGGSASRAPSSMSRSRPGLRALIGTNSMPSWRKSSSLRGLFDAR